MKKNWQDNIKLFLGDKKIRISIWLFSISGLLLVAAQNISGFGDWYYKYVYKILLNTVSRLFSIFPFSVYEVILIIFILYAIYGIFTYLVYIFKKTVSIKKAIREGIKNILLYTSLFVFLNMIGQSINCFKSSFVTLSNLKVQDVKEEQLIKVCETLRNQLNILDKKIEKNEDGLLILDEDVGEKGIENMKNLSIEYSCLNGFYPNPKSYILSEIMSYQLLQGETTFTIEANYNNDMADSNIPSTICHELSHIQGFNNENEANYISFLACINSDSYAYQYSGYLMAYIYCMNDLAEFNEEAFKDVNSELSQNVKNEIKSDSLYWNNYRGGISKLYSRVYDVLLKIGGQEEGMKSYNGVVKLLVSSYESQWGI